MRLLVVTHYFWPENFRVNDLVAELVRRGHQVTVLTGPPNYPDGHVFPEYRANPLHFATYSGAEIVRVPLITRGARRITLALNYLTAFLSAATFGVWRLRNRSFDAIFVFQPSPVTTCLPAILIGWLKHAPVALWVLDLWPDTLSAVGVLRSQSLLALVGRMVSFIYRRCSLILAQSRGFMEKIVRYRVDPARVHYFPAWVEPLFNGNLDEVKLADELAGYADTFNVLFAGNIGQAQDFPTILDAAETLRDRQGIRWLVVGDGRAAEWVRREITRRGLGDHVKMLGRHPLERMPSFFRGADALLVTLKRDPIFAMTIPGKVQTYLATGLPIVGTLDGEGARVLRESGAALVSAPGDGAALARLVAQLASLPAEERSAMGARGVEYARREFDRERLLTQLEGWLKDTAEG